jgi:hypothetical protein
LGENSESRTGNTLHSRRFRRWDNRHRVQPGFVDKNYEEHRVSNPPDGRYDIYDEYAQVDVTMLSVMYSIEPPSITAHSALVPVSNVAVRVENSQTTLDNRREATLLHLEVTQHKKTQEIAQIDMEVHGSEAGKVELGVSMVESAHLFLAQVP